MYAEIAVWSYGLTLTFFFIGMLKKTGFFLMLSGGLMLLLAAVIIAEGIQIVNGINTETGVFSYYTLNPGNDFFLQFVSYLSVPFGLGLLLFGLGTIGEKQNV